MKNQFPERTNTLEDLATGGVQPYNIRILNESCHERNRSKNRDITELEERRILDFGYKMQPLFGWRYVYKGDAPKHATEEIEKIRKEEFSMQEVFAVASEDYKIFIHPEADAFRDVLYRTLEILQDERNVGIKYFLQSEELQNPRKEKLVLYAKGKDHLDRLLKKLSDGLKDFENHSETREQPPFTKKCTNLIFYRQGDADLRREGFLEGDSWIGDTPMSDEILSQYFTDENFSLFKL